MRWLHQIRLGIRSLFLRGRIEHELDKELRFHLERQIAENIEAGMSAEEARVQALRSTGNLCLLKEECDNVFAYSTEERRKHGGP